jgi:hypothetical protein
MSEANRVCSIGADFKAIRFSLQLPLHSLNSMRGLQVQKWVCLVTHGNGCRTRPCDVG